MEPSSSLLFYPVQPSDAMAFKGKTITHDIFSKLYSIEVEWITFVRTIWGAHWGMFLEKANLSEVLWSAIITRPFTCLSNLVIKTQWSSGY